VRDQQVHARVLNDILTFARDQSFTILGLMVSPLKGPAGNIEFLAWLGWGDHNHQSLDVAPLIAATLALSMPE